jgi:hypothetical protein
LHTFNLSKAADRTSVDVRMSPEPAESILPRAPIARPLSHPHTHIRNVEWRETTDAVADT